MGNCIVNQHGGDDKTVEINKQLQQQRKEEDTTIRILLLGAGDSGKSTFLRQMKIMHLGGFDRKERERCAIILRQNLSETFKAAVEDEDCAEILKKDSNLWDQCKITLETEDLNDQVVNTITQAWSNPEFQDYIKTSFSFQSNNTASFLFNNIQTISDQYYLPSDNEILYARSKSTGLQEIVFPYNNGKIILIDVGGQRSERRKWIDCFDSVTAVIFITALDEYDLVLSEDLRTNRMKESLELFRQISENPFLEGKRFILFLNKYDVFKEKIKWVPLNKYLDGISEDIACDYKRAGDFVAKLYENQFQQNVDDLNIFFTCAIETNNCKKVFKSVLDHLEKRLLQENGLM